MPYYFFHWNDQLVEYLDLHDISITDFQNIVMGAHRIAISKSTGREICFGWSADGRYVACVYEWIDDDTILPITAYEVEY
ncbi:hypothetical protein [Bythopirellula goksoeyrii]|uniref:DUF4258 domain-containing protein n=1 Tax=Bythopirellula goksoeyrii TaxID=1400387 RepID=A0A5B9QLX9_9BACT|nr:hypothetical protein [Bythopirellula goksoeyrii]QEG38006.1 hypothetical protein Pr1d_53540 [Bythopirellula goksoeyrii]